ncbi:sensor histidine kinase [Falsibacillus pallidus]|uniref:sensor histidine kinase n=1 Tax=Falsibacillus pallidus TaxID=493781 RepID=UPI003D95689A
MKTLYVKFTAITIGIMLLSSIIAFLLSNAYYQEKLKPYNDKKITKMAQSIAAYTDDHPDVDLPEYLDSISSIGYQMFLIDKTGDETFYGAPFRVKNLPASTRTQVLDGKVYHGILHFPQALFVTGFFANELTNTIGVPLTHNGKQFALFIRPDIKLLFNEMHLLFAWLLGLTILLSILLVLFSTKYMVKPISTLTSATKSLAEGDFNVELAVNRRDELGELSRSFLGMAKKLEQLDEMRKEFISNISHDIQSPLSNIKGYTNLLENESLRMEDRREYTSIINGEIERLSTMTKQLLLLASLDRNDEMLEKKRFNVGQQIKELVRNYQWLISEKGIMVSYSLPDVKIIGDPSLLHTVWDNLISNAIKYNKPDGSIDISIEEKETEGGGTILVTFKDTGIGLNQAETERIFDRFYRADAARTRTIEGTGLGLSIVQTILHLHHGRVTVKSVHGEGTVFTVKLPAR